MNEWILVNHGINLASDYGQIIMSTINKETKNIEEKHESQPNSHNTSMENSKFHFPIKEIKSLTFTYV